MTFKKIIGLLHLWLGLASGLVVFVVSITGCIFVFEEELFALFHRKLVDVPAIPINRSVMPVSVLKANAQRAIGTTDTVNSVNVFSQPEKAYEFSVFQNDRKKSEKSLWDHAGLTWKRIYVNPYTGQVQGVFDMKGEFFITVRSIHQNLYLNPAIGSPIVGSATLIFIVLLVSGLILWWPRNRAAAKQRFWFKWKESTQWKRKNYDLHNIPGFYVSLVALFIALTGIVWSFQWWENIIYRTLDGRIVMFELAENPVPPATYNATVFDKTLEQLRAENPGFLRIYLDEEKKTNTLTAAVNFEGKDLWTHYNYQQFDLSTGKEFAHLMHDEKTTGQKWRNSNYDLHTGKTLGFPGMLLAFVASLVCASLPVTGLYIWWGRRNKSTKKRPTRVMIKAVN